MKNTIEVAGHKAILSYDPEIGLFRGEFLGLNGGADFYGKGIDDLLDEGAKSLAVFMEMCAARGIDPLKSFSGKFNVRLDPATHEAAVLAAAAEDKSLNEWVAEAIATAAHAA